MHGGSRIHVDASADAFAGRYASAYRVVYRLLGDAVAADVLARDAMVQIGAGRRRRPSAVVDAQVCRRAAKLALSDELWFGRARCPVRGTGFGEIPYRDERRALRMAVRLMSGPVRAVFVLQHLAGWAPADVAAALKLHPAVQARRSARALATIEQRSQLHRRGMRAEAA